MAKFELRIKARDLRRKGVSVKQIATRLGVSKSTASIWVRDIVLSIEQLAALRKAEIKGAELGRLKGALAQKQRRLKLINNSKESGIKQLSKLTSREFLIAGLALYWGEGTRKNTALQFCNSDPKMVKFLLKWIKVVFKICEDDIRCSVSINEIHKSREERVKSFWSELTKVPLNQFTKTSFKKTKGNKVYDNFDEHYGTLRLTVVKPSRYYYHLIGLIEGLHEAGMKLAFQDVS